MAEAPALTTGFLKMRRNPNVGITSVLRRYYVGGGSGDIGFEPGSVRTLRKVNDGPWNGACVNFLRPGMALARQVVDMGCSLRGLPRLKAARVV